MAGSTTFLRFVMSAENSQMNRSMQRTADTIAAVNKAIEDNDMLLAGNSAAMDEAARRASSYQDRLSRLNDQIVRMRDVHIGDTQAQASLAALQVKAERLNSALSRENIDLGGVARAEAQLLGLEASAERLDEKLSSAGSSGGFGGLLGGGGGIAALVAGLAALSPVIASVGAGLTGFGAAAYADLRPIEAAAKATGGLAANMHTLDPQQQAVAQGLLGLEGQFKAFAQAEAGTVFRDFASGLKLAGDVLRGLEPVAHATGLAVGGLLHQIDQEFQSGTWQGFFKFMAATVGPDIEQIGGLLTGLLQDLPPLIEGLQPLAQVLIGVATDLTSVIAGLNRFHLSLPVLGASIGALVGGPLGALAGGLVGAGLSAAQALGHMGQVQASVNATIPAWTRSAQATHAAVMALSEFGPQITKYVQWLHNTDQAGKNSAAVVQQYGKMLATSGSAAAAAGPKFFSLDKAVNALSASMTKLIGNLLQLQGSELSWKQALQAAETQVNSNTAGLAGNSKNALANKQAVLQASNAALSYAQQELNTGKDISGASNTIQAQIKWLQSLHDKSDFVRQELTALQKEEALLAAQRIRQTIHVEGLGQWQVSQSLAPGVGHRRAAGGLIPGTGNRDTFPALLTPGELVVPKGMVAAGAVDHLRGMLPGFAGGGIVPRYAGAPGGLTPWVQGNDKATINLIDRTVVKATLAGMRAARATSGGFGIPGPGGGSAAANAALARRMMPAWGSGAMWTAWNWLEMMEAGWNQFARNPSSGAYGIPQALPPGKMGPAANPPQSNPAAQISWMIGYIRSVYGNPVNAAFHERMFHWYGNGGLISEPILGIGRSGRRYVFGERGPETVVPGTHGQRAAVNFNGGIHVYNETDEALIRQKLSFAVISAGLGS